MELIFNINRLSADYFLKIALNHTLLILLYL